MSVSKKIFTEKLHFRENAFPKVRSLENIEHQPKTSDIQIHREILPWLRYNKPNLPENVKEQINRKQYSFDLHAPFSSENEIPLKDKKLYLPSLHNESRESKSQQKLNTDKERSEITVEFNKKSSALGSVKAKESSLQRRDNPPTKEIDSIKSKKVIILKPIAPPKKVDAATETDQVPGISVQVQTMLNLESLKSKKLKNALKNSNTFDNNYLLRPNGEGPNKPARTDRKFTDKSTEEVITSRVIETFLPSLSYSDKENKDKSNQSYSYYNYKKSVNSKSTTNASPGKHLVTHAGVSFLDQYWASQRWIMLNRENNDSNDGLESTTKEIPSILNPRSPKYSDSKEKHTFKDLFNERKQHYSEQGDHTSHPQRADIDVITAGDLKKLVI